MNLELMLKLAAVAHLGLVAAGASMPLVVKMREHTAKLPPFLHRLFYVYYAFIGLCLVAFGAITFLFANHFATGEPVARALAIFLSVFWTIRLIVAWFVFDMKPYLTCTAFKWGNHLINVTFIYLVAIYLWAALFPSESL